jgi:hypothetical protein
MRIRPSIFGMFILVIFLGTVYGFRAAGVWSVSGKVDSSGQSILPSADDVETIKGWMTLEQISTAYNVPLADLLAQFSLPADTPASTAIKDLENETFSVTGLREWLQSPTQPTQPQVTPTSIPQVTEAPAVLATQAEVTPLPTEHVAPDKVVNAKTTFQDLLDWGVPAEAVQTIIGADLPSLATVVKDYVTQKGMEFAPVKTALQAEVDKTK